jgi:hypothetical protein
VRLWSLHPRYLDPAGLVAVWREGLLAQAVLGGLTRGYRHHPQLLRFREQKDACIAIATYLHAIADEADRRGYAFDRTRITTRRRTLTIDVEDGQLDFEWRHLKAKLRARNPAWYRSVRKVETPDPHPAFVVVRGSVAAWER